MINQKTVLILGAGASKPYKFPIGDVLKAEICRDLALTEHYRRNCFENETVSGFRKLFYNSPQESIDAWLGKPGSQPFEKIGKYAIARVLLKCETTVSLFKEIIDSHLPSDDPNHKPTQCWYRELYKALDADCPLEKFHENNLSVVTFNYDRSLEHFIHTSLQSDNDGTGEDEIAAAARSLEILHVHGQLGYLPWQKKPVEPTDCEVPYDSGNGNPSIIDKASKHIKIIHEATDSDAQFEKARKLLRDAQRIYILGFGYGLTNLRRLGLKSLADGKDLRGTAYKVSLQEKQTAVAHTKASMYGLKTTPALFVRLIDKTVYHFLRDHVIFA